MKIRVLKAFTKFSLLVAMLLVPAVGATQGQSLANSMRANIPFDFSIANKKLPSGKYFIERAQKNSDDTVLSVSNEEGSSRVVRSSHSVQAWPVKDKAMLVFHRYGDQYFLYQVWPAGESIGREFYKSRTEREVERALSTPKISRKATVETVTIVVDVQ